MGSVTSPTGMIDGHDYADLIDAYAYQAGSQTWVAVLTDRADGCSRKDRLCAEDVLVYSFTPLPDAPVTLQVGQAGGPVALTCSAGTYDDRCRSHTFGGATAGTVQVITVDRNPDGTLASLQGSYTLSFAKGAVSGWFNATGC
jgi:hypothetical protein